MSLNESHVAAIPHTDKYYDLGNFTRTVTTFNVDAQVWFNRGLTWAYGFNHDEATFCFEQVVAHDPKCAIGYWGIAYAAGPNYNKSWQAFDGNELPRALSKCHAAAQKALELADTASPVERALIDAIQFRFPFKEIPNNEFGPYVQAYAARMRVVYHQFGAEDIDVTTLAADALMNMAPWQLYEPRTGKPNLNTPVLEIKEILEAGMKFPNADFHPGVLHLFIHLVEMSNTPEIAIRASDKLRHLVPESGHLLHMPSHIDFLVGEYSKAVEANTRASIANNKFFSNPRPGSSPFYNIYRLHDYHSLIYGATMAGQSVEALQAVKDMEAALTEDLLRTKSPPMADWIECFLSIKIHTLIRFGLWEDLKNLSIPEDKNLYCVTITTIHYGKAIAWAATQNVEEAEKEVVLFQTAKALVPNSRLDFPNKMIDILNVAEAMLEGELEYRRGNYDKAYEALRVAVERDDKLVYSEPWGWMLPARHAYGALLLEQGHVEEAAAVYAHDLGLAPGQDSAHQHPNNVWGLHGYHECLVRLGREGEAKIISQLLKKAVAIADVPIQSSCFCRLETEAKGCGSC